MECGAGVELDLRVSGHVEGLRLDSESKKCSKIVRRELT